MFAIYKRELKSYMLSLYGPLFIGLMLLVSGIFTFVYNYRSLSSGFEYTVGYIAMGMIVLIPLLCMRSIAQEKKTGTIRLLYALPLKSIQIILGKYLALLTVVAIPIGVMAFYPLILSTHGSVYFPKAYVSLLMLFCLGAALTALCMFLSSVTDSMVVASVLGIGSCLLLYLINFISVIFPTAPAASFVAVILLCLLLGLILFTQTKNWLIGLGGTVLCLIPAVIVFIMNSSLYEALFSKLLNKLAFFSMINNLAYGSFKLSMPIVFISTVIFFFALTVLSLEKKRNE